MRVFHPSIVAAALLAAAPSVSLAGTALGASFGEARVNDGPFEGSDSAWKAFIGTYGELIGGEVGYVDFGEQGDNISSADAKAWTPAILIGLPVGMVQLHGKFGVAFPEVEGASIGDEYEDNEVFYGALVRFGNVNGPGMGVRLEYERFDFGPDNLDLASIGLELRFGARRMNTTNDTTY